MNIITIGATVLLCSRTSEKSTNDDNQHNTNQRRYYTSPKLPYHHIRTFVPAKDQPFVNSICKNVYGGTDYLPQLAPIYASDPLSSFYVLCDENDHPLATANLRRWYDDDDEENDVDDDESRITWLEGVRTSSHHRNRGLATTLLETIFESITTTTTTTTTTTVLTCTVESNVAMTRIFETLGMRRRYGIHLLDFSILSSLPGWSRSRAGNNGDDGGDDDDDDDTVVAAPLLQSLGLHQNVTESARRSKWTIVASERELKDGLSSVRKRGGCGHFPFLWDLVGAKSPLARDSLEKGLIRRRVVGEGEREVVVALMRDERITSLRSNWVCSVAATTEEGVELALWHACTEKDVLDSLGGGDVGFAVAVDGIVDITSGGVCGRLPFKGDKCWVYGKNL